MLSGKREFMVGMKRDPLFGPSSSSRRRHLRRGSQDITLGVTPLEDRDIEGMLSGIRASALLGEFRGMPPVDRSALASAIARLRALPRTIRP